MFGELFDRFLGQGACARITRTPSIARAKKKTGSIDARGATFCTEVSTRNRRRAAQVNKEIMVLRSGKRTTPLGYVDTNSDSDVDMLSPLKKASAKTPTTVKFDTPEAFRTEEAATPMVPEEPEEAEEEEAAPESPVASIAPESPAETLAPETPIVPPSDAELDSWASIEATAGTWLDAVLERYPVLGKYAANAEIVTGRRALDLAAVASTALPFIALGLVYTWRRLALVALGGVYPAVRTAQCLLGPSPPKMDDVEQWLSFWVMAAAALYQPWVFAFLPTFYLKVGVIGWLVAADTCGAKVVWDNALKPVVKPFCAPKETCVALVKTGRKLKRRISTCFSPSPVDKMDVKKMD